MPIDPKQALGAELAGGEASWDADKIILYHLGIGAGVPATDPRELSYTYEQGLKVIPSFGVIPVFGSLMGLGSVPGMSFNPFMLVHGEQDLEIHKEIPVSASVKSSGKVAAIYDKGSMALVIMEMVSRDEKNEPLFTNRFTIALRGEGGFGGEPGPAVKLDPPARNPDHEVEIKTLPQQALLYRLSGDKNPLHADPSFAQMGGFDRPILHGLCTYGIVCKAVVDAVLGGATEKVARYQARFSKPVFPGDTIVVKMWQEGKEVRVVASTKEGGAPVITNSAVTLR